MCTSARPANLEGRLWNRKIRVQHDRFFLKWHATRQCLSFRTLLHRLRSQPFAAAFLITTFLFANIHVTNAAEKFPGVGRTAIPAEIKAWDIDVRPDFKGLPAGSGSVQKGQKIWESKCASCHGTFGESNEVFTPITGGTTGLDAVSGRVASLRGDANPGYPQRTTLMKLSEMSALWDYINRAMPWDAPKSLAADEVYAVTAYILNLGDIVPADFVLSDRNIAEVQAKLPNRNGTKLFLPLWDINGRGDVVNFACMKNCKVDVNITSSLPDFAKNAHGNLADQNRLVGATRGVRTDSSTEASDAPLPGKARNPNATSGKDSREISGTESVAPLQAAQAAALAKQYSCVVCHAANAKLVGPSYNDIAAKYKGDANASDKLVAKIRSGGAGVWGAIRMPSHATMSDAELKALVHWSLAGGN